MSCYTVVRSTYLYCKIGRTLAVFPESSHGFLPYSESIIIKMVSHQTNGHQTNGQGL